MKKRNKNKLIFLSIMLFVLLNPPVLRLFNAGHQLFGLPLVYTYVFIVWLLSILFTFWILKKYYE